jgi:hypothetical protein
VGVGSAVAAVISLSIIVVALLLLTRRKSKLHIGDHINRPLAVDSEKFAGPSDADQKHELVEQCTQDMGPADTQELGGYDIQEFEMVDTHELGICDAQKLEAVDVLATESDNTSELEVMNTNGLGHDTLELEASEAQHIRLTALRIG